MWMPNPQSYGMVTIEHAGKRSKFKGIKSYEAYNISGAVRCSKDEALFFFCPLFLLLPRSLSLIVAIFSPSVAEWRVCGATAQTLCLALGTSA